MKKILRIGIAIFIFIVMVGIGSFIYFNFVQTVTRTWDGGGSTNNWSEDANWSSDTVPTSADTALFNGTSVKNAIIDSSFGGEVASFQMASGYTGTITQARSLTIGTSNWIATAGNFVGSSSTAHFIIVDSDFTLNGSNVTSTSGTLFIGGFFSSFDFGSGSWHHGFGELNFNASDSSLDFDVATSASFYDLTINLVDDTDTLSFNASDDIIVINTFTAKNGRFGGSTSADLITNGDIIFEDTFDGESGGADITINSSASRTVTFAGEIPNFDIISAPNYTFNVSSSGAILEGNFTMADSTFSPGSNAVTTTGIFIQSSGTYNLSSAGQTFSNAVTLNGGAFVGGTSADYTFTNNVTVAGANIDFNNSGDITISGDFTFNSGNITSTSGTLTVQPGFGGWDQNGGTFFHNNGTVVLAGTATNFDWDIPDQTYFNNLTINLDDTKSLNAAGTGGDIVYVTGTLRLLDGKFGGSQTTDMVAKGPIIFHPDFDGGSGYDLIVSSTVAETIVFDGKIPDIVLDSTDNTYNITSTGNVFFDGTFDMNEGTVNLNTGSVSTTFQNAVTINGGTFTDGNSPMGIGQTLTVNGGNFIAGSGNYSGDHEFPLNVVCNSTSGPGNMDFSNAADVAIGGNLAISCGNVTSTVSTLTVGGDWDHNSGDFHDNSGTVLLTGTGSVTVDFDVPNGEEFNNLTIDLDNNETWNFVGSGGDISIVNGTLRLTDGQVGGSATTDLHIKGPLIIDAGFDGGGGDADFIVTSTLTRNVVFAGALPDLELEAPNYTFSVTSASAGATFEGKVDMELGTFNLEANTTTFGGILTLNGGTFNGGSLNRTFGAQVTVNCGSCFTPGTGDYIFDGELEINSSGVADFSNQSSLDFNNIFDFNGGTVTSTSGIATFASHFDMDGGTFNHNNGTVLFNSSVIATFDVPVVSSPTFNNIFVSSSDGSSGIATSGDDFDIIGDLTIKTGAVINGSGDFNFIGTGNQTIDFTGATANYNTDRLEINKTSGLVIMNSDVVFDASNSDFVVVEGVLNLNGNNLTVNGLSGDFDIQDGGTLRLDGTETFTLNGGEPTLSTGSTVEYFGSSGTVDAFNFHHLSVSTTNNTQILTENTTIGGDLTVTGTLYTNGFDLSVTGNVFNNGTIRTNGDETFVFTSGYDTDSGNSEFVGTSTYTGLNIGNTFYDITFNESTGTWSQTSTLDVNNNLTITAGTFNSAGNDITLGGAWSNTGTYQTGGNTVTLDGTDQTISGNATSFNNFTKTGGGGDTLTLPANVTITVTGTLNWQGTNTSSQMIIKSSVTSTRAIIDPTGSRTVQWLNVTDINNTNATAVDCFVGCTDGGNTLNWDFGSGPTAESLNIGNSGNVTTTVNIGNSSPTITAVIFTTSSGGSAATEFNLTENTTTTAYIRGSISDDNGCEDFTDDGSVTITNFRSGLGSCGGADNNNCYITTSCTFSNCSAGGGDTSLDYECTTDIFFYADPTNGGGPSVAQNWTVDAAASDGAASATNVTTSFELNALVAIDIGSSFDYGAVALGATSSDVGLTITNTGNVIADTDISGTDMSCTVGSIAVAQQRYSTSSGATYASMTSLSVTPTDFTLDLPKQTTASNSTTSLNWKIQLPSSGASGSCTGTTTLTAKEG